MPEGKEYLASLNNATRAIAGNHLEEASHTFAGLLQEVSAGGPVCALNIPAGTWHTLRSLESGTVILEVKDGAYEPIQDCDVLGL